MDNLTVKTVTTAELSDNFFLLFNFALFLCQIKEKSFI